jgi:hypothetical protein
MTALHPLEVISHILEDEYQVHSLNFKIKFLEEDCDTLVNKYFALVYVSEEEYYLSFCLNTASLYDASFYTLILTELLNQKLIPYVEHYVDIEDGMMYFGEKAYIKNKEMINKRKGLKQCPICDKYLPLELFKTDTGFCVVCEKITLEKVTFH